MSDKKKSRLRRARKVRARIRSVGRHRLCVFRASRHIHAQVLSPDGARVMASASTVDPGVREKITYGGNVEAARIVGACIAERALAVSIRELAFDRSGFSYHGRVKALAEAAREGGLAF